MKANTNAMKITRHTEPNIFTVQTGEITADLRPIDSIVRLDGNQLVSIKGFSILPNIRVKLGPVSLAAVIALQPGEIYESQAQPIHPITHKEVR